MDPSTGDTIYVGGMRGFGGVEGLAFDPRTQTLYATGYNTLAAVDPLTAEATIIGSTGFEIIEGLGFDTTARVLYGTESETRQMLILDTATGRATPVGSTLYGNILGLTVVATPGDCDGDDDVDLQEYAELLTCTIEQGVVAGAECVCVDSNGDQVHDLLDFRDLQILFTTR